MYNNCDAVPTYIIKLYYYYVNERAKTLSAKHYKLNYLNLKYLQYNLKKIAVL